jgi:hypothetical protein
MKMGATISNLGADFKNQTNINSPENSPGISPKSKFSESVFESSLSNTMLNIDIDNRYIFTMTDYIETLYQVTKKNFYEHVEYYQIEMSVFNFILNIVHKCESILMD